MIISLGSDHRGEEVRDHVRDLLKLANHEVLLFAAPDGDGKSCDYPDVAHPVAAAVTDGKAERGILVCGSGIGMSIAANKVAGVRAALVHDEIGAQMSRQHNDANVLCLSADMLGMRIIDRLVTLWLETSFEGGRHARRVDKIMAIEKGLDPTQTAQTTSG
jgi:ribose 5-phosphate isomerase B